MVHAGTIHVLRLITIPKLSISGNPSTGTGIRITGAKPKECYRASLNSMSDVSTKSSLKAALLGSITSA